MAAPVISDTQGALGFLTNQSFSFQPGCLNAPTSWAAVRLPAGVTINSSTGLISGAVALPGIYVTNVTATNTDGSSTAQYTIAIEAGATSAGMDHDMTINSTTGIVSRNVPPALAGAENQPTGVDAETSSDPTIEQQAALALGRASVGDDLIFRVQIEKDGTVLNPAITALTWTLKELESDAVLVTSDAFIKPDNAVPAWRVHTVLTGDALTGVTNNYTEDGGAFFVGRGQFHFTAINPDHGTFGPATTKGTSAPFYFMIALPQ